MSTATPNTKKPSHRVQPVVGVDSNPEQENEDMTSMPQTTNTRPPADGLPVPGFPPPTNAPTPKWATETTPWEAVEVDNIWFRDHKLKVEGFTLCQGQESTSRDVLTSPPIEVWPDFYSFDGTATEVAAEARNLASSLLQIADALDGPRPAGANASAGDTQHRVVAAIRARIAGTGLLQNEVAVAAGYGTNEMSEFMTGKRLMDLTDVERIARALGTDPFALMWEAGR